MVANIKEKYEILQCLYNSGKCIIYSAINTSTNERVAIKTFSTDLYDLANIANLKKEYNLMAKIESEFVMRALDYLKIGDGFYIIMEYCDGITLSEYLSKHMISVKEFLYIAPKIVSGISDIHKKGIIHKDLNPSNIIYDPKTREVTIIDFGISTEFSYEKPLELNPNSFEGTLNYLSPEQTGRMNRSIDFRTDFYSLGVSFYEMLCGSRPFESDSPTELIYSHIAKIPPLLHQTNPSVPYMLSKIIARLMSKMPEDRYANAAGIIYDLNKCLENLDHDGKITEFELGYGDYTYRFEIPKKLYGRGNERSQLLAFYNNIVRNGKEWVVIGGYSGVGKTSLVNELHKPIVKSNGIFISGKFDQYQRNVPYYAFFQAIDQFCGYILSEPESKMVIWKAKLAKALEKDGKLLTGKVPRLGLLVGEQQDLPELSPLEERAKFKSVIQNLLRTVASPLQPLVLFIDDIHLTDMGSLEVIEDIMNNDKITGLLIISCYRDNEVDEGHPLLQSLRKLANNDVNAVKMHLSGLEPASAVQMVADTFHCGLIDVGELAEIIYKKTGGNPFYIRQFLKHCQIKGFIRFNLERKAWQWDTKAIYDYPAEENVVDFLIKNMDRFSAETKKLLSLGACIGQIFDTGVLAYIAGEDKEAVLSGLKPAVSLEIIYPLQNSKDQKAETEFSFAHDRFQQACYTILGEEQRSNIHYSLAAYYEKVGFGQEGKAEEQFVISDHYCKALKSIDSEIEKRRIAGILLRAAHAANLLAAFDTAVRFLEQITGVLSGIQEKDDSFLFSVYSEYHAVLYSLARYDEADGIYRLLEMLAKEPVALADSCCLQAISLSNRGRFGDAFMLGVALVEKLGVHYPENELAGMVNNEINAFYEELRRGNFSGLDGTKETADVQEHAIVKVLDRITPAGFFYNPMCSYWAIITNAGRLLKYGYTPEGLHLYSCLILPLIQIRNDFRLGYTAAFQAIKLAGKQGYKNELYRIYMIFSLMNNHWVEDIITGIPYALESIKGNVETGDFEIACHGYFATQNAVLESCHSLEELGAETESALAFANKTGNKHSLGSFISFRQLYKALKGETLSEGSFNDDQFSEQKHVEEISNNGMALCYFYTLRALSAVIYSDYETAFKMTEKAALIIQYCTGHYLFALHNFLHSLAICKRIEKPDCGPDEKLRLLAKLEVNRQWLYERATDAPVNFSHLYNIIEAEIKVREGSYYEAIIIYEKAIDEAESNKRPYHYALLCELAAMSFMKMNLNRAASAYLKESYMGYLAWEAQGKTLQMKQKYQELLSSELISSKHGRKITNVHSSSLTTNATIDLNSVIEASQAISGEIQLDSILEKLIHVLLQNAGAQDNYFLIKKDNGYEVQVEGHSDEKITHILHKRIAGTDCIPLKIVDYVERTHESVILDNALESDKYGNDEHILMQGCKSVMCMPVISKGDLKGILYFENNLVEGAFDRERIEILKIIASQLAISLENAYLYNNLKELVEERTRELRDEIVVRQKAEKQLQEMANHDHLTNLSNRRMFQDILAHSIELTKLNNSILSVLFVDLDGFKAINDQYGHDKGDLVLVTVAQRLLDAVRSCDTVSRMGGDEFVLILENIKSTDEIKIICRRIIDSISDPIMLDEDGTKAFVTSSIGVSILPFNDITAEDLIKNADKAMYAAKDEGKNRFRFFDC
jgi:diguanylate cyclase (GGDEF)-like protein